MRHLLCLAALLALGAAHAESRLYLLSQYDWGKKAGFYVDLEGDKLAELPLILGIADGKEWEFRSVRPGFVTGREYVIRATIGPEVSTLELDGQAVGEVKRKWLPSTQPLIANDQPTWARGNGDWVPVMTAATVAVKRAGAEGKQLKFEFAQAVPDALRYFEPSSPQSQALQTQPGDTLSLEMTIKFIPTDLKANAPFIDRYGQAIAARYPEKIAADEDLRADIAREDAELAKMPPSPDFDRYGGWKLSPWKEQATGFFRTVNHEGKWWLLTPEGNPCFFLGVCGPPAQTWETTPVSGREYLFAQLPPREGLFAAAWARNQWGINDGTEYCCLYLSNLIRKYGPDWSARSTDRAFRRMQSLGLQGGKWGCGVPLA